MTTHRTNKPRNSRPPFVPEGCSTCPIGYRTICRPLLPRRHPVLDEFRNGTRVISPRRSIYDEGEQCSELYNVLDGWVVLYAVFSSGERQILDVALPGAFIGYQSNPSDPMRHSAEAITPISICAFPRRQFMAFLNKHPELSIRLTEILADQLDSSRTMLANLGGRRAFGTLANLFLMLYRRSREIFFERAGSNTAYVPLTQEQLAATIGTSSVHVSNLIKEFRLQNLIDFHTPVLTIKDYEGLLRAASCDVNGNAARSG